MRCLAAPHPQILRCAQNDKVPARPPFYVVHQEAVAFPRCPAPLRFFPFDRLRIRMTVVSVDGAAPRPPRRAPEGAVLRESWVFLGEPG